MKTGAFPSPLLRTLTALALSPFLGLSLHGAAPVLEEPVPSAGTPKVVPVVPVGKALLIPLSAYDSDGDSLSFSVTSSNPNIMARVKTGNPLLQMQVFHGAGAANDPTYTGTMVFQLFRDWTPMTTGLISGFAQSGLYDGIKLQRLADLNDDKNAATPAAVTESFIYQGGASVGFQFENEFSAPLLFSGRGQLCMANAGTNNYKGTNGGQFFITNGNFFNTAVKEVTSGGPRHLDFKHTVFGQLTHGWDVLQKLHDTPRDGSDQPLVDVKVITASVSPQYNEGTHVYTDGVLVLTAKGPGTATILVTVTDSTGVVATQSFTATAQADTHNALPFLVPPKNAVGPKYKIFSVPLAAAVDLEFDYLSLSSSLIDAPRKGQSGQQRTSVLVLGDSGYEGRLTMGFGVTQYDMDPNGGGGFDDSLAMTIGIGDALPKTEAVTLEAFPTVNLANATVARFVDAASRGVSDRFTARINWGDGTPEINGAVGRDAKRPQMTARAVVGSHTYVKEGVYTVSVDLKGDRGARTKVYSHVYVSAKPLKAQGRTVDFRGRALSQRVLATFIDPFPQLPGAYLATVDWGDGTLAKGTVAALGTGKYAVLGTHTYIDAQRYAVSVRIHKSGDPNDQDAIAWSTLNISGFVGPKVLPPFAQSHLIGEISRVEATPASNVQNATYRPLRALVGTGANERAYFTCQMIVVNSGNLPSLPGKLKFALSADPRRLKTDAANVEDVALKIGAGDTLDIPVLQPNTGIRFICESKLGADTRLQAPAGENGTGLYLHGVMVYRDPVADYEPIDKAAVTGPFNGITVTPTSLQTTEAAGEGHAATFDVSIDRQPAATKVVVINVVSANTAEGTVSPLSLTFTPEDWQTAKTVTVTGVDDQLSDGNKSYKVAVSMDTALTTDTRFLGLDPADVSVINVDDDPKVTVTPGSLTTTEGAGSQHSATFTVKIDQAPQANTAVVVALSSNNAAEGTLDKSTLTFTEANWADPQTVTVTGVDDALPDGDITYKVVITMDPTTTDTRYASLNPPDVTVTNKDDEPKMIVTPKTLTTTEASGAAPAQFSVRFDQAPTPGQGVTVTLSVTNSGEGSLSKTVLNFDSTNATKAQTVYVTGVDDFYKDGPVTYNVVVANSTSPDTRFNGVKGTSISVTNLDDE